MDFLSILTQKSFNKICESFYKGNKNFRVHGFIKDETGNEVPITNKIFHVNSEEEAKKASTHLHTLGNHHYRADYAKELTEDESDLTEGFFTKEKPLKYSREDIKNAYEAFSHNKVKTVNALKVRALDAIQVKHKGDINSPDYDADLNRMHWHVYRSLDKHLGNTFTPNEVELLHGLHENTIVDTIYKHQEKPEYDKLIQKLKKYKPVSNTPTTV